MNGPELIIDYEDLDQDEAKHRIGAQRTVLVRLEPGDIHDFVTMREVWSLAENIRRAADSENHKRDVGASFLVGFSFGGLLVSAVFFLVVFFGGA